MIEFSDEKFLLDEIKKGNNQAFEYLFKTYYPRLRGYAIRFVEDEETARDIIQECFLRFWEKRALLSAVSVTSLLFAMVDFSGKDIVRSCFLSHDPGALFRNSK